MFEVLKECEQRIEQYQNQLAAILEYQELGSKFEKALYGDNDKKIEIIQLSDALKLFFYLGIPKEKWFLIAEIMEDLSKDIDTSWRSEEWFLILQKLLVINQDALNSYLGAFEHFLKKEDPNKIIGLEIDSYVEKHATNQIKTYEVEENIALAIIVKHNFENIFENATDFKKHQTTIEGIDKTFSFLILLTMAYPKIHEEKDYFMALIGLLLLYRSDLLNLNQKIIHKELELQKLKEENKRLVVVRKQTPENFRLIEKYTKYMETLLNIEPIDTFLQTVSDNQTTLEKEQRELRKQINHLKKIMFTYSEKKDFYSMHPSISQLLDLSLQKRILRQIRNHNKNNLAAMQKLMEEYQKSDFEKIAHLLNSYGCNTDHLTEQERSTLVSTYSEEEIKNMVDALEKTTIDWKPQYYFLLTTSNLSRIQKIEYYIKKKYLTERFLLEHMEYFEIGKPVFSNFEECLQAIEDIGIDPKDITKKNATLWKEESSKLKERIALHKKYGTSFLANSQHWYDYLESDISFDLFDEWIELGFLGYTRCHAYLLREQNKLVGKKIRLMQEMGFQEENRRIRSSCFTEQYINEKDLETYFEEEYIQVRDPILEKANRLQISTQTLSLPIVRELDTQCLVSDSLYKINDVFVSRNRFLRNLDVLKDHPEISVSEQIRRSLIYTPYSGYTEEMIQKLKEITPSEKQKKKDFKG